MPCPNKSSVYTGVSYHKYRKKYEAYVHLGKKKIHVGQFEDEDDAARAVEAKRQELGLKSFNELPQVKIQVENLSSDSEE
jgi:hypothetical protein